MSHMVIFEGEDGVAGQQLCDDLDGAVGYVESLRNDHGIDRARIFRMEEIRFELTPYYVVSLADAVEAAAVIPPPPVPAASMAEEPPFFATPEPQVDTAPLSPPAEPSLGSPFAEADAADPVEGVFGDAYEAAQPAFSEPSIPPVPPVGEEVEAEGSGRRGLFGR